MTCHTTRVDFMNFVQNIKYHLPRVRTVARSVYEYATVFVMYLLNQCTTASLPIKKSKKDVVTRDLPQTKEKNSTKDSNA